MDTREALLGLRDALRGKYAERDAVIDGMLAALIAGEHVLLLGPPGTAKSALARSLCASLHDSRYFEWLFTKFTTPEEVFGPVSLSGLKADRFERVTRGKLPEAHVAFLDEIWKANSSILNALLTALNERVFHNNGGAVKIPLETLVGASNELPEGPELGALFDRFLVRHWVEPVRSVDAFTGIMLGKLDADRAPVMLTLQELHDARAEAAKLPVVDALPRECFELREELRQEGVYASDRRWKRALGLLRAAAWIAGDAEVDTHHMGLLSDVLWSHPDERDKVRAAVQKRCGREIAEALQVHDAFFGLIATYQQAKAEERERLVQGIVRDGKRAEEQLQTQLAACRHEASKRAVEQCLTAVTQALSAPRAEARRMLGLS